MKRMILAFVLVTFSSCVVHAQDNKQHSSKEKGDKRAKDKKKQSDDDVQHIDFSGPDEPEDSMPAITPKGKL